MSLIISVAYLCVLISAVFVIVRWGNVRCTGPTPVGTLTLVALLFTAGLDMGLVMLPLTEFPAYQQDKAYAFTNPLAIEFGMWGPLVWLMYFLSAFYFVILEPRLQVFKISAVKWVYNLTVIATCAFTCYLFMQNLPAYVPDMPTWGIWALAALVIAVSVYSSADMHFMKWLAILSTWGFGLLALASLAAVAFIYSEAGFGTLLANIGQLGGYFTNLHRFTTPITDYHEFYLFWWFSWSIMIGEFVSRFVGGLKAWRLAFAMVVLPAIPLGLWFCVLYIYYEKAIVIPPWLNWFMIFVGLVFVVNSLDSLIRLYAANLNWGKDRFGIAYYPIQFALQFTLVCAYFFTPFRIEWVGLVVLGLYAVVYVTIARRSARVGDAITGARIGA
ncbi:MAG: BCCT family transporter [Rhizobiaceae bacterium]|nr:BCCT family transporter [Rhizobiaceae bacterium]